MAEMECDCVSKAPSRSFFGSCSEGGGLAPACHPSRDANCLCRNPTPRGPCTHLAAVAVVHGDGGARLGALHLHGRAVDHLAHGQHILEHQP
jgi:hypothetical protein